MGRLTSLLRRQPEAAEASAVLDLTLDDLHRPEPVTEPEAAPSEVPAIEGDPSEPMAPVAGDLPPADPIPPAEAAEPAGGADLRALLDEVAVLAAYVGRLRREITALGPDRLADMTLPAAQDDLRTLQSETHAAANAILSAADALLAARPLSLDGYQAEVADRAAAIRAACVFGPAVDDRLARTLSVLNGLGTRLARVGEAAAAPPRASSGSEPAGDDDATRPGSA